MGNRPDFCRNLTTPTPTNLNVSYGYLSECWTEKLIADILRKSLPLIILPISLVCNSFTFMALRSRHMRGTSTAFFMLALSVLDPLILLTKNLVYFPTFVAYYSITCRILYFFIYVLGYTNVWILVIMTADKFFAVWFPLKVSYFCTISRARCVCTFLLAITGVISSHHFWTIDSLEHPQDKQKFCYYNTNRYSSIQHIWRYFDFVIWCFLPFILIFTLSVLIIYRLRQKRQGNIQNGRHIISINHDEDVILNERFRNSRSSNKTTQPSVEMRSTQKTEVIRSRHRHITLMLLAVAGVFLLLTLPNSIYFVLDFTYGFNRVPTENDYYDWLRYRRLTILTVIMFQLSDLQHAMNFFLYMLTSDKFRRTVLSIWMSPSSFRSALFCCFKQTQAKHHNPSSSSSSLQYHSATQRTDKPYRSSTSDMSNMSNNTRYISNCSLHVQPQRASYRARPIFSKPPAKMTKSLS